MELKEVLQSFCLASATAGTECDIHGVCRAVMAPFGTCKTDKRGNFICTKEGTGRHFLLDAHLDQIGFVVVSVEEGGFLKVNKVGGMDRRVCPSQEVEVLGKEKLFGVIGCKPPHLTEEKEKNKAPEFDDLFVDTGLRTEVVKTLVQPGDRVVFRPYYAACLNGNITATSLDDRAGMAIVARAMELLEQSGSTSKVTAVFSVQEETNGQGAANASFYTEADEAIAVDVSFAAQPEVDGARKNATLPLGGGVFIGFAPILDRSISKAMVETAKAHGIPYRAEVMGGNTGTNADDIAKAKYGMKTVTISPPIRNMHTPVEMIHLEDMEHCAQLIAQYIMSKEGEA